MVALSNLLFLIFVSSINCVKLTLEGTSRANQGTIRPFVEFFASLNQRNKRLNVQFNVNTSTRENALPSHLNGDDSARENAAPSNLNENDVIDSSEEESASDVENEEEEKIDESEEIRRKFSELLWDEDKYNIENFENYGFNLKTEMDIIRSLPKNLKFGTVELPVNPKSIQPEVVSKPEDDTNEYTQRSMHILKQFDKYLTDTYEYKSENFIIYTKALFDFAKDIPREANLQSKTKFEIRELPGKYKIYMYGLQATGTVNFFVYDMNNNKYDEEETAVMKDKVEKKVGEYSEKLRRITQY